MDATTTAASGDQVLTVRVGTRRLGLPAVEVGEVLRGARLTRVPQAPPALSGVASVRGQVVPVVSLGRLLGAADDARSVSERVVLLRRSPPVALQVDEVTGFGRGGWEAARPGQLVETDGGAVRLVDLDALLRAEFGELARRVEVSRPAEAERPIDTAQTTGRSLAFLAFGLAAQVYALALEQVSEVISVPPEIARLPGSDQAMLGAFSWRGALTPAASVRALLGLPAAPDQMRQRMIIARIGDSRVGLVVDDLRAIIRAPERALQPVPRVLNRGAGEARIKAMLRTPDTRGLIAVLAPDQLFQEESVAQILEDGRQEATATREAAVATESFVIFRVGPESYGLPIGAVQEVVNLPERLNRIPRAPAFVAGVMNLRGEVVPLIEQRRRFGVEGASPARRRVVVTRVGELRAGFIVDEVSEILQVPVQRLQRTPELAAEASRLFDRIADLEMDGRVILLVDPQQLLDRAEADLLAGLAEFAASQT